MSDEPKCGATCPMKPHVTCILDAGHAGWHQRYADGGGDRWRDPPMVSDKPKDWVQLAKERAEAATPGPWLREDDWMCEVNAELRDLGVGSVTYKNVVKLVDGLDRVCFRGAPDAEFIAAARSDIPRLIACVEAADVLADLVANLVAPLKRRWCHMFDKDGNCGLCALDAALAAYRTARARGGA